MDFDYAANLFRRLEETFPAAIFPEKAAKVRMLKRTFQQEITTKKILDEAVSTALRGDAEFQQATQVDGTDKS